MRAADDVDAFAIEMCIAARIFARQIDDPLTVAGAMVFSALVTMRYEGLSAAHARSLVLAALRRFEDDHGDADGAAARDAPGGPPQRRRRDPSDVN